MSTYRERMIQAQNEEKIIYYDYLGYKEGAGWYRGMADDWHRPEKIIKSKYNSGFLLGLPNYYFLGFPIKELLDITYSICLGENV